MSQHHHEVKSWFYETSLLVSKMIYFMWSGYTLVNYLLTSSLLFVSTTNTTLLLNFGHLADDTAKFGKFGSKTIAYYCENVSTVLFVNICKHLYSYHVTYL